MTGLVVLEKMGMLVLLMAVGFAAAKANWVGDGFNQATSRLVANVFLPASILSSVIGVAPLFSGKELAVVIAGTFVLFGLCAVGGLVVSKVVPMPKQDQLVAWLSIFFMNNVFVGFPVVQAIFGEEALFCASLTNIPFNILLFSIGVSRLRAGQGQGRVTIREVFSPGLIATLVAVVVFLFQIPVPSLLGDTIKSLANGTVPLSMIIIGVSLSHVPILDAFKDWKAYLVSLTSAVAEELREMHSPVYVGCLCPGPVNTEFNAVANVQFALKGITPEFCVRCALHGIHRRKTIIVPGPLVAAGMTLGRYLPRSAYIKIAAHQQQKKLYR